MAVDYYFYDGANSSKMLHRLLTEICGYGQKQIRLLDFASGYGCVTRHLKNHIPFCMHTACDIHPEAVRFIEDKLSVNTVLSTHKPEDLNMKKTYDVVFALSFFSHMPKSSFSRWLRKLASIVKPEGFLIFSTHGLVSRRKHFNKCKFDEEGFYFRHSSEQKDLDTAEYGMTVVRPEYVLEQIFKTPNLTLKYFHEGYWWNHQDIYIAKSTAEQIHKQPK
jgi:2-polyprenyl-3-methyl-5-hydroxy-6-metoxy-1,4-benzoquinol methylase